MLKLLLHILKNIYNFGSCLEEDKIKLFYFFFSPPMYQLHITSVFILIVVNLISVQAMIYFLFAIPLIRTKQAVKKSWTALYETKDVLINYLDIHINTLIRKLVFHFILFSTDHFFTFSNICCFSFSFLKDKL